MNENGKLIWLTLFLLCVSLAFSEQASSDFNAAQLKLQSQDWTGAIQILEELKTRTPDDPRVWYWLGVSHHTLKQYDQALEAHLKAASFPGFNGRGMYNAACVYALQGKKDEAFAWLEKAKATNAVDISQAAGDPDLSGLKDDPRFAELLPKPSDFEDPFVEPARVIQEWRGQSPRGQFGWIARNIGDVDGDGVNDVTTSAPTDSSGGPQSGRVFVYSSRNGKLLWTADGEPGGQLGLGIEAAGDTNRDGIPDVIAAAPGAGKAFVYSGRDGRVLLTLEAESPGDVFGRKVSDLGDFNDDGYADVLVGAPGNSAAGRGAGRAYIFSGQDGSKLLTLDGEKPGDAFGSSAGGRMTAEGPMLVIGAPNAGPANRGRVYVFRGRGAERHFVMESDEKGSALGAMFVSVVGDLNRDGTPDVYGSDWSHGAKGATTGRVYLASGADGILLYQLTGENAGDGFGIGVADAGDATGDGHDDLIIGAWQHSGAAPGGGKVYLYSGKDGSLVRAWTCQIAGETFGFDATGMGDVDGDGKIDFLLTSAWSGVNGFRSGRIWILGQ